MSELLEELNHKPFQKREGSRYRHFKEYEQKELKPLPLTPYEYAIFKRLKGKRLGKYLCQALGALGRCKMRKKGWFH